VETEKSEKAVEAGETEKEAEVVAAAHYSLAGV
jgi:hypothetical protein